MRPHERDHERPEVLLAAVAERVQVAGVAPCEPAAEQEQNLVAGVSHRVDALGEHRRRPGEAFGHELHDGDPEVGEERRQNRSGAAVGRHSGLLGVGRGPPYRGGVRAAAER